MRTLLALLPTVLVACGPRDHDGDGHLAPMDCDDADPAVNPTAGETCDNGVDDDCDGAAYGCGPAGVVHLEGAEVRVVGSAQERMGDAAWVTADFDGDDVADAALANWEGGVRRLRGPLSGESALEAGDLLFERSDTRSLAAGDLDGDGRAELVVGVPGDIEIDVVYVVDGGSADGSGAEAAVGMFELPGEAQLAVLADTTGDDVADLVVSATGSETLEGAVWILWRVDDGPRAADDAGVRLSQEAAHDLSGVSFAGGDIDGDGLSDVIVGAPYAGDVGRVYVVASPRLFDASLADADAALYGQALGARFGESVATGDLDGDGLADVVVSDRSAGAAWVFSAPFGYVDTSRAAARIDAPPQEYNTFAYRVAVPGDVTGDGRDDVLVGEPYGYWRYGCAWLYSGPISGVRSTEDATAALVGESWGSEAGLSIGGAGDLDEDGVDDLFVSAPDTLVGDDYVGAAYVVFGGPGL